MKKMLLLVLVLAALLSVVTLLSACTPEMPPVLETNPPPETEPYVPKELTVEFFYASTSGMSPWQKYPADSTVPTVTTTPTPSQTEPEEA